MTTHGEGRRRIRTWMPVGVLVAVVAVAGCERGQDVKAPSAPVEPPPPSVVVAEVLRRPVPIMRDFVARTEGVPTAEIRARVQGVLESVRFKEGSDVSEGQVLFVLQQAEYQAALRSARAQLAKAQADLTRARDVSVVARAEAQLRQAQADLGKARKDVARYQPLVDARAIPVLERSPSPA
jgi:membrane fusion protein (multidrug efflux system)